MSNLFLVYEIDGPTKVPQIQGDKAYDSIHINFADKIDDCDEDFSYFGYLYDKKLLMRILNLKRLKILQVLRKAQIDFMKQY